MTTTAPRTEAQALDDLRIPAEQVATMIHEAVEASDTELVRLLEGNTEFYGLAVAMTQDIVIATSLAAMIHPTDDFNQLLVGANLARDNPVLGRLGLKLLDLIEACDRALFGLVTPDLFASRMQMIRAVI